MQCDSATSPGQNSSADSTQSSPFSSAVSESEVDASSLSCQSSSVADTKQPFSNGGHPVRNTLRIGNKSMADVSRMRPACLNPGNTSDEDAAAEDTTNNGFWGQFRCERRNTVEQSGITWRSRSDTGTNCTERGRKTSLPRPLTPSPSVSGRSSPACLSHPVPPRSRVADIRRESNCSMESEAAHERLMQIAQQVKTIRPLLFHHQCYSPSTRQIVRNNITYSPSPSPTPSPTRHIMRSLSPMAVRQVTKRRYTSSANVEADASDLRTPGFLLNSSVKSEITFWAFIFMV
ncbi:unnamed protein product [Gongylonema pulchrum]|uniref:Uncharacterized protein n=1 Tax=Gongylonema pulchrum TaxID=637853 RepID=A0A183EHW1_9BILA|nr:unnamed protein product [Gongylonema pulchrum]